MFYLSGRFEYENVKTISSALYSAKKLQNDLSKLKLKLFNTKDAKYLELIDTLTHFELQLEEFRNDYMICLQKDVQCHTKTLVDSIFIFLAIFKDIDEFSQKYMIENKRVFTIF